MSSLLVFKGVKTVCAQRRQGSSFLKTSKAVSSERRQDSSRLKTTRQLKIKDIKAVSCKKRQKRKL